MRIAVVLVPFAIAALMGISASGLAAPPGPLDRQLRLLPRIDRAIAASRGGSPTAIQERYDAARELAESLRSQVVPPRCERLAKTLRGLIANELLLTESYDRRQSWRTKEPRSTVARRQVEEARGSCGADGRTRVSPVSRSLALPGPGEAFFGRIEGTTPKNTARALVKINGVRVAAVSVMAERFSARVSSRPGRVIVETLFLDSEGRRVGSAMTRDAWLLPASASTTPARVRADRSLSARLATVGLGFDEYAAIRVERLTTGTVAGWNGDARFPAASTVKLAVMIEAARRFGLGPKSPVLYDVERAASWSSNLAANRLLRMIGKGGVNAGVAAAERRLRALGANSSSYPGEYRVGTSLFDAPRQPPLKTTRLTTARDLARVLRAIHLAAIGERVGHSRTGLTPATARVVLRTLLETEAVGDNVGLIRPSLPQATPIAQKNGWLFDTRATAAIAYRPSGPVIIVVIGYRAGGLSLHQAQRLGTSAIRVALRG